MKEIKRLEEELKQSHIDLALEAGADLPSAVKSAEELIDSCHRWAAASKKPHSGAEEAYRDQIDRWWASGPVCPNDPKSQIDWLKHYADEATLHAAVTSLNIGDELEVLSWVLGQSATSFSGACYQLVAFVGAGSLRYDCPQKPVMAKVAQRVRTNFYKGKAGLASSRAIGTHDRSLYMRAIEHAEERDLWTLPDRAFGPFPPTPSLMSRYVFEDGTIRISFEEWRKAQN